MQPNKVFAPPEGHDIEGAVKQGVSDSFPWPSEIQGAIWDGTREAIERR
jgi:hypothetical protein